MKALLNSLESLDDDSLYREYLKAQEGDSPNIGSLRDPAMKRAYLVLDRKDEAREVKLSRYQRFLCHLAGDFPRD